MSDDIKQKFLTFEQDRISMDKALKAEFVRIMDILWGEYKDKTMELVRDNIVFYEENNNAMFIETESIIMVVNTSTKSVITECWFKFRFLTSAGTLSVPFTLTFAFLNNVMQLCILSKIVHDAEEMVKDFKFFGHMMISFYKTTFIRYQIFPSPKK
jgi:hypothetical protein